MKNMANGFYFYQEINRKRKNCTGSIKETLKLRRLILFSAKNLSQRNTFYVNAQTLGCRKFHRIDAIFDLPKSSRENTLLLDGHKSIPRRDFKSLQKKKKKYLFLKISKNFVDTYLFSTSSYLIIY